MANADRGSPTSAAGGELTMSSITGKLVLSLIRGSDYAHAGEEEAIELVLGPLEKRPEARLLDVGCGIGGTARYVIEHGWGTVTGVDLDRDNIVAAKERHPGQAFICSDAVDLERHVTGPFDVVYLFNAFFLFTDQPAALEAMRAVSRDGGKLALFDYVDLGGYTEWQEHRSTPGLRNALQLDRVDAMLSASGWTLDGIVSMHPDYQRWYEALVERIELMHAAIVAKSSEPFYEYVLTRYTETRDDAREGRLGGATIYATAT